MNDIPEKPSKTALKKEMHSLQTLGKQLVELSEAEFAKIPVADPQLTEAIATARRIKSHEGLRRQMQYIGKLMRQVDTEAIEAALTAREEGHRELARQFHALEELRDKLVSEGIGSIETVMERYPAADRQHLRQLILQANKESKAHKPPAASRKLFRYLRELHQAD